VLLPKGQNLGPKLLLKILRQELGIVLRRLRRRNAACGLRRRAPTPTSALTDKAEVLRPYWTQRNDPAMEAALSAIRQRAEYEIGVRSKPLEKEQAKRADRTSFPEENKSGKVATLKTAGIIYYMAGSYDPTYLAQLEPILEGLRKAGVPKE
jgi:hypothetical protein